jgi:acyl-coenzyme A thioesterase PaaI-like protein
LITNWYDEVVILNWFFKKSWAFRLIMNIWPPMFFAGIRVTQISKDFKFAHVQLTLRPWNKNAVGSHFGGSLFAMTDPFYMLMILSNLGKDYVVWDKSADIDFIKPGKGKVTAEFQLTQSLIDEIINKTANGDKYLPEIPVYVKDQQGQIVAKLNRTLYIRRKKSKR